MSDIVANPFAATSARPTTGAVAQSEQRSIAEVQAAVLLARKFPRDQRRAMDNIINAFTRPGLAEVSQYQYSKGGSDVSGPSIRAAEAIAQQWGNIEFGFRELSRDTGTDGVPYSEVEAYAWDIETLVRRPLTFIVRHWRDTRQGGYQIKEERDIYELIANMAQRRVRACLLAILPGDVIDAAMRQADMTLKAKADTSPENIANIIETFAALGVTKEQIETRIQRRIEAIQPAQIVNLKKVYASIRDGMSTPADWFTSGDSTEQTKPAFPEYSDDAFETEFKVWENLIKHQKRTAEEIINIAGSKAKLSEAQKEKIRAVKVEPPSVTFEQVKGKLDAAIDIDELNVAADLIKEVKDKKQQKELTAFYNTLKEKFQ